jgi:hypothetical protein
MSRARGLSLQNALARYLSAWWPYAESAGAGRPGSDVLGTPGIVWENKTAARFDPQAWVRQAKTHAITRAALPVTVYWPVGVGEGTPGAALAILPLPELVDLLVTAGYAGRAGQLQSTAKQLEER